MVPTDTPQPSDSLAASNYFRGPERGYTVEDDR